jgi:TonB family protein
VINEQGTPEDIYVVNPLGYGFDEAAVKAVKTWTFLPGAKDGKPVKFRARVYVNFGLSRDGTQLIGRPPKEAEQAARYDAARRDLRSPQTEKQALGTIQVLANEGYPPALFAYGKLLETGAGVPVDPTKAFDWIAKAAKKDYPVAVYDVGLRFYEGRGTAKDLKKGLAMIQHAARLNDTSAQFFMGAAYEQGRDVPKNLEKARESFRKCANSGEVLCQIRFANSLLSSGKRDGEFVRAVAFLETAAAQAAARAKEADSPGQAQLAAELADIVQKLKTNVPTQ